MKRACYLLRNATKEPLKRSRFFKTHTHSYRAHCWRCSVCDQAGLRMITERPLLRFLLISPLIPGPVGSTQSSLTTLHTPIIIWPPFFLLFHLASACFCPLFYSFPLLHSLLTCGGKQPAGTLLCLDLSHCMI